MHMDIMAEVESIRMSTKLLWAKPKGPQGNKRHRTN